MYRKFFKRFLDFITALVMLLIFTPLMLILALLVKLTSEGPVFFRQKRGGKDGVYFEILKFRSMTEKKSDDKSEFDAGSDMRVTRIGKILRKTKLDELPQLINVLKGEMSFTGPRPEVKTYIDLYPERWEKILSVRPGITDPASIEFRNEEEILAASENPEEEYRNSILPVKLTYYEQYVDNISLFYDIKLILKTVFVVLFK
jgi:lipopolysaccharide/colanic/teichoic acid biosynthesis glycosyltransferase